MKILCELVRTVIGMFLADRWLTGATLALVTLVAGLGSITSLRPLAAGSILLFGCLTILAQ
jgi:hypothetical protein